MDNIDYALKEAIKTKDISLSDLIVSKDNMLEAISYSANTMIGLYAYYEKDKEKVEAFKNNLVNTIKISQDAGGILLMIDVLETNMEETENE